MHHSTVIFCIRTLFAALVAVGWVCQLVVVQIIVVGLILFMAHFAGRILYGAHRAGSMAAFASVMLSQTIQTGDDDAEDKRWFLNMSETRKLWSMFLTYDVPIAMLLTYFGSVGWGALYLGAATVLHILLKTVRGQFEATSD